MPNLKKSIYFTVCGEEICLDVTWQLLEKAERAFSPYTISTIPWLIQDAINVQRTKIADLISLWVQEKTKLTRDEIRGYYFTCSPLEFVKTVGKVQACICWSIRNDEGNPSISDEAFEKLANGIDLTPEDTKPAAPKAEAGEKPKKPRAATSRKRTV